MLGSGFIDNVARQLSVMIYKVMNLYLVTFQGGFIDLSQLFISPEG